MCSGRPGDTFPGTYSEQQVANKLASHFLLIYIFAFIPVFASYETVYRDLFPLLLKEKGLKRPTSPHVMIYAFPPIALSSITNRVTGVLLSVGI